MDKRAISLVGFKSRQSVEDYIKAFPRARFELAYNMSSAFLSSLEPLLAGRVVSLHACCPLVRCFPNFASSSPVVLKESFDAMDESLESAKRFHAELMVLHPGYATDSALPSDAAKRTAVLQGPDFQRFVGREEGSICTPDYIRSREYRHHFALMKENLAVLAPRMEHKGVRLAIENLNPRAGYLCLHPDEFAELASMPSLYFCLDVGHLWISHFVLGFDFFAALAKMMATGRVLSCHLHSNPSDGTVLRDAHEPFEANGFPFERVLSCLLPYHPNLVLEQISGDYVHSSCLLEELYSRERK